MKKGNFRKSKRIHFAIENLKRIEFLGGFENSLNSQFTKIPEVKRKEFAKKQKNYLQKKGTKK